MNILNRKWNGTEIIYHIENLKNTLNKAISDNSEKVTVILEIDSILKYLESNKSYLNRLDDHLFQINVRQSVNSVLDIYWKYDKEISNYHIWLYEDLITLLWEFNKTFKKAYDEYRIENIDFKYKKTL